jgi:MFS family permease
MNQVGHSALFLSMISTLTSLPFFLFTLPASTLADMMDRGRLVAIMHIWLAAAAACMAVLGWLNLLNGHLLLFFVFLIGTGFAFNAVGKYPEGTLTDRNRVSGPSQGREHPQLRDRNA